MSSFPPKAFAALRGKQKPDTPVLTWGRWDPRVAQALLLDPLLRSKAGVSGRAGTACAEIIVSVCKVAVTLNLVNVRLSEPVWARMQPSGPTRR